MSKLTPTERGIAIYSPLVLQIYDYWVLNIVNTWAWRCPTKTHLLPLFTSNIGSNHLDIGVGTGYYLANGTVPQTTRLTLCDLSPAAMAKAKARTGREDARELLCDVLKPLPVGAGEKFDSVSMYFLLHCLPGPVANKTCVFEHVKGVLREDGVVTGATVLGKGVEDNFFGGLIRRFCVFDGIMSNETDDVESFVGALKANFEVVEVDLIGVVLVFKAMKPKL
ncbi:class I SAM-dependent methyltransferase [Aspergillus glaucus CBS 516.65]|uniref:Methyltransferase type 12 domain-containing protein n=1 Tax=Aspergillus glaucus CBS 516.65 TaxID=1160497 RepID=A0A1L9VP88_ASPGL|nr:hypothetical protein ASPGLDRAFT_65668 [Aspergillus glaucus CBS 516.65]OJJ85719.1 hypothetical protein ASPGLDRAFT_65668 [Aspergillus glaucus CBS 516.65]